MGARVANRHSRDDLHHVSLSRRLIWPLRPDSDPEPFYTLCERELTSIQEVVAPRLYKKLLKRLPPFEWIEKQTLLQIFVKLP
jgi:hypothetical protein